MIIYYDEKLNAKIRVFISSTFRDMHLERNLIVGGVFPLLRREYKKQSVDIMEVDLRWGITEKDIERMTLLEICISETLNCVPFFVGLIGDNYGTLAKQEEIRKLPPSYKRAIGMKSREDIPSGISLTELEMRAGVFTKDNKEHAKFFIRKSGEEIPDALKDLKAKIMNGGYSYATYESPREFESKVSAALKELIDANLPKPLPAPYRDRHYVSHLRLLKKSNASYVPNDAFIEKAEREIGDSRCVYIFGEKGSGKTSAISYLIAREGHDRDGEVFFHFADADEESLSEDNLFHRLRLYFENATGTNSADPNDYNAILELLKKTTLQKKVTLYFDAIEKFRDNALLSKLFLLSRLNPNVSVVCTGAKPYKKINGKELDIIPLSNEQLRQISLKALHNYGKKLEEPHMKKLLENPSCRNPLYLNALLSLLIAHGDHESFEDFFERLMAAGCFRELFFITIDRLLGHFRERGFDDGKIYPALSLIAHSGMGIKESELSEILGMLPIERSILLASIELFITENDTLIRFGHDLITEAVKSFLKEKGTERDYEKEARECLITYFGRAENADGLRAYSEAPYQLEKLGRLDELFDTVSNAECFLYLAKNQFNNLIRYLIALVERAEELRARLFPQLTDSDALIASDILCQAGHYVSAIECIRSIACGETDSCASYEDAPDRIADAIVSSSHSVTDKVRLFAILARSYYKLTLFRFGAAERAYLRAIEFYRSAYPDDEVGLAAQSYLLGVTYKSMGDLDRAEKTLRFAAEVFRKNDVRNDVSAWIFAVYGNLLLAKGELTQAKELLRCAIADNMLLFGEDSGELAWSYSYAWNIYYASGERSTAFDMAEDAYAIYDALYHGRGAKIAWAASNLGTAKHVCGNFDAAEQYYSLSIKENNAPLSAEKRPHVYTLTAYTNLALLEHDRGNTEKAIGLVEFARSNSVEKNGENHLYTANILLNEGIMKHSAEIIKDAIHIYERHKTPDLFFARICYIRVLFDVGEEERAEDEVNALYAEYEGAAVKPDIITYLLNDSFEKISFSADEVNTREVKEALNRFVDYKYYIPLNNSSALIAIPEI